jgi:hypothetical protein
MSHIAAGLLILFHAISLSLQISESPLTRFPYGPENNDSSLPRGDDEVASQDFFFSILLLWTNIHILWSESRLNNL